MKAVWSIDYDYIADKCYNSPQCPKCLAPVWGEDERYLCISCGEEVEVDKEMKRWIDERSETKVDTKDCPRITLDNGKVFGCGGKNCVEAHYVRNPVTLNWQLAYSTCKNCGGNVMV